MSKNKKQKQSKSKKVLLVGLTAKSLKGVAALVEPQHLVIPMIITSIIAQIANNKKETSPKDIQQMESIRTYSRALSNGDSRITSANHALANTLLPEITILQTLSPEERKSHLLKVREGIATTKGPAKVDTTTLFKKDTDKLAAHRRGLALQCRSKMQAMPIYNKTQLTIGLSIKDIDLETIIESAKELWSNIGRDPDEFDCILMDAAPDAKIISDAVTYLMKKNLEPFLETNDEGKLVHGSDIIVLKGDDNLTPIERKLGFLSREVPNLLEVTEIPSDITMDPMLEAAIDQQKQVLGLVQDSLKKVGLTNKAYAKAKKKI